jgi:hypothetical protein
MSIKLTKLDTSQFTPPPTAVHDCECYDINDLHGPILMNITKYVEIENLHEISFERPIDKKFIPFEQYLIDKLYKYQRDYENIVYYETKEIDVEDQVTLCWCYQRSPIKRQSIVEIPYHKKIHNIQIINDNLVKTPRDFQRPENLVIRIARFYQYFDAKDSLIGLIEYEIYNMMTFEPSKELSEILQPGLEI